jgi:GT2 family glycosyltransferase
MEQPLISIISVNWNGLKHLQSCLASVIASEYKHLEIIIIDNGSTDGSLDFLRAQKSLIRLIENRCNLGYVSGNNQGFSLAKGEYIAALNNDAIVEPSWLNDPVRYLQGDLRLGIVGCRLMDANKPGYIDGLFHEVMPDLGLRPYASGQKFDDSNPRMTKPGYVISVHGGAAIYRKKMIDELKGFDETYWAYYEECDLCMRAFLHGWKCLYVPSAIVHHIGAASFNRTSKKYFYFLSRNRLWFIFRSYPLSMIIHHLPFLVLFELRLMRVLFIKFKLPSAYFKSRWDALRGVFAHSKKRHENIALFKKHKKDFYRIYREKILFIS